MFYAVAVGYETGIFHDWPTCSKQVNGFSGAKYKKFKTEQEAMQFIAVNGSVEKSVPKSNPIKETQNEVSDLSWGDMAQIGVDTDLKTIEYNGNIIYQGVPNRKFNPRPNQLVAFVDGSFMDHREGVGYGAILIMNGENNYHLIEGRTVNQNPEMDKMLRDLRNVTGELSASMSSIHWAIEKGYEQIDIYFDYTGVRDWADGNWKAKNLITQSYVNYVQKARERIKINFHKVDAHTGDFYNEVADRLAKL